MPYNLSQQDTFEKNEKSALVHSTMMVTEDSSQNKRVDSMKKANGSESKDWKHDALEIQQGFYEKLGDRTFDFFKADERWALEKKIGFALFGEPSEVSETNNNGYSKKVNDEIIKICKFIYDLQNGYSEVTIAFLFVIGEVDKRLFCIPVFKILNPSDEVIFLDQYGRVYKDWVNFKENNKLPKSIICYPKDGVYQGDENDSVLVTFDPSPAFRISSRALSVLDTASTVVTVGATAVGIVSLFVPVVGPIAAAAVLGGTGSGIYGLARGSHQLYDRAIHKQSISLGDSTARNCWLSVFGSAFGVGSSLAVKGMVKMAANGQVLGKVGRISVNLLNYGSLTINGLGVANGLANLIEKKEKGELGKLDILQFTASVLFFTNAAMNTKTASNIIKDVQSDIITDFRSDLSKRRENAFEKVVKKSGGEGTMEGNARIIKGIKNVGSKDEFFRMVIRGQKQSRTTRLNDDGFIEVKGAAYVDTPIELQTHVKLSSTTNLRTTDPTSVNPSEENNVNFLRNMKTPLIISVVEEAFVTLRKTKIKLSNGVELEVNDIIINFFTELLTRYFPKAWGGSLGLENVKNVIIESENFACEIGCSTAEEYFEFARFVVIYQKSKVKEMEKKYQDADDFLKTKLDQDWNIQDSKDRENSFLSIVGKEINESNEGLKNIFEKHSMEVKAINNDGRLKFKTNYTALNEFFHSFVIDGYGITPREFFEIVRQVANDENCRVKSDNSFLDDPTCITFSDKKIPVTVTVEKYQNNIFLKTASFKES